jgi:hypothetical protein
MRTAPGVDARDKDEKQLGQLSGFDPSGDSFVPFSVCIEKETWQIAVEDLEFSIPFSELPHVFPRGRILLQAFRCRAVVRRLRVDVVD